MRLWPVWLIASVAFAMPACAADTAVLAAQVAVTENNFAKAMADRDFAAFSGFISEEAVFFTGASPLRGKVAVTAYWHRWFVDAKAPFSWKADKVEVLDSGTLALSSGPVFDSKGKPLGSFTSIWRQEAPGTWRIIFDKGCGCAD